MWSQNCTLRPGDAVVAGIVPCEMIPMPGALEARVPLDCRYWELAEIIFVRLSDSEDASECVVLGSARFGDIADDEATLVGDEAYCPIWRVAGERPGWEAEGTTEWRLPCRRRSSNTQHCH